MAYAPCSAQGKDAVQLTLEQIDLIKRMVETYPHQLELVKTSEGKGWVCLCSIMFCKKIVKNFRACFSSRKASLWCVGVMRLASMIVYMYYFIERCFTDIIRAHGEGKIASLITVESGHSIGTSLAVLRQLYQMGARSLTLTHNCHTPWWVQNGAYAEPA